MKLKIRSEAVIRNIRQAEAFVNRPVSLMFKDYYSYIYPHIKERVNCAVYGKDIAGSVCYSIGHADARHTGAVVSDIGEARRCLSLGIRHLYIPVNAYDDREGLCVEAARGLSEASHAEDSHARLTAMVTSGCLNSNHPSIDELAAINESLSPIVDGISLGGSFWIGYTSEYPDFVTDIRIGEYMLFGTVPYSGRNELLGENAVEIEASVVGVYGERGEFIIDCGYSLADIQKCAMLGGITAEYVNTSSEYTIFRTHDITGVCKGQKLRFAPNYKSLVKLRYADREFE